MVDLRRDLMSFRLLCERSDVQVVTGRTHRIVRRVLMFGNIMTDAACSFMAGVVGRLGHEDLDDAAICVASCVASCVLVDWFLFTPHDTEEIGTVCEHPGV